MTEFSDVLTLDSESCSDKSVTWSNFVVSVDNNRSIEYQRISSEDSTAEGSAGICKSKIPMELENRKVWQSSNEHRDCNFYLH